MYFFFKNKKQYLDLTGNLILSHNDRLVKVRSKSAGPTKVLNSKFILNCGNLNFRDKLKATKIALSFIWGKPNPLTAEDTNLNKPKLKVVDFLPAPTPRDWVEDSPLENGNYENKCTQCNHNFIGHKRRVICKDCQEKINNG